MSSLDNGSLEWYTDYDTDNEETKEADEDSPHKALADNISDIDNKDLADDSSNNNKSKHNNKSSTTTGVYNQVQLESIGTTGVAKKKTIKQTEYKQMIAAERAGKAAATRGNKLPRRNRLPTAKVCGEQAAADYFQIVMTAIDGDTLFTLLDGSKQDMDNMFMFLTEQMGVKAGLKRFG